LSKKQSTKYKIIEVYSDDSCRIDDVGGPYKVIVKLNKMERKNGKID